MPMFMECSCRLDTPCHMPAKRVCALCEVPYCDACLRHHHRCKEQPQVITVPERVSKPEPVPA